MRALAHDPAERYASVESFAEALTGWLRADEGARAVSAQPVWKAAPEPRFGRKARAATLSLALLAVCGAWWFTTRARPAQRLPASLARGELVSHVPGLLVPHPEPSAPTVTAAPIDPVPPVGVPRTLRARAAPTPRARTAPASRSRPRRDPAATGGGASPTAASDLPPPRIDSSRRETLLLPTDF
jgi:hypothetical protein